ncbi:MAG: glycosyltransferase family 2 protein [Clostridia bacterium]|nr:glycosyltransferase family 2 protein [Clostridia bacterium]
MIVKNEQDVLERCLKSVKDFVCEIIIVDTGSTDNTKQIAQKFTNKVYDFKWENNFSKARNFSFSKATCPYILWLDADDVIEPEQFKNWQNLIQNFYNADVIMLPYDLAFDKNNQSTFFCYRERIVKNNGKFLFTDPVHEVIIPSGKIIYQKARISHRKTHANTPQRNLKIYRNLKKQGVVFSPRQQYYYARELYFNGYTKMAKNALNKFIEQKQGWSENLVDACILKSFCHQKLNQKDLQLKSLLNAFLFDKPRADVCCEIGNYFIENKNYLSAVFWFENALKVQYAGSGFIQKDYLDFTPSLQLCLCYYHLQKPKMAYEFHKLCKALKPNHPAVINNENFFKNLILNGKI